jgi:hypothetical protein
MRIDTKNFRVFAAFKPKFQGVGFLISFDNVITCRDYLLIEIKFLWFNAWMMYQYEQ